MKLQRWPVAGQKRWELMRRVSSGITGKDVEVTPGGAPSCMVVSPKEYYSRIFLPTQFLRAGNERFLNGSLAHELLHVLDSQPFALRGLLLHQRILSNGLEDARLELQLKDAWPGLVRPIRQLSRDLVAFRLRSKSFAHSVKTSMLYEVGVALYLRLTGIPRAVIAGTVTSMALAVTDEVYPIALRVPGARDTSEVAEIARDICSALAEAADKAARRLNTAASRSWASSFKSELKRASQTTLEEVLIRAEQRLFPGWFGPWLRGGRGYSFFSTAWNWDDTEQDPLTPLAFPEIHETLLKADPLLEEWQCEPKRPRGRLTLTSNTLVEAAIGRGQPGVFERISHSQRTILPSILQNVEVFVFVEAHSRYRRQHWLFLKALTATLARTFAAGGVPLFVVRASTTTRAKEWVESKLTKRKFQRWSSNHYVEIATLKGPRDDWTRACERTLAAMPRKGFNQPLEAYPRMKSWSMTMPKTNRLRFYMVLGTAEFLNVMSGHLKHGTSPLRGRGRKAAYVHVGTHLASYDQRLKDLKRDFDFVVQATTLQKTVIDILQEMVLAYATRER